MFGIPRDQISAHSRIGEKKQRKIVQFNILLK